MGERGPCGWEAGSASLCLGGAESPREASLPAVLAPGPGAGAAGERSRERPAGSRLPGREASLWALRDAEAVDGREEGRALHVEG